MFTTLRHPRQSRSVSIGPQSAADAYETLAFRAKRRRESISSVAEKIVFSKDGKSHTNDHFCISTSKNSESRPVIFGVLLTAVTSKLNLYQYIAASHSAEYKPPTHDTVLGVPAVTSPSEDRIQYENEDREMFSKLEKPRVRYDVEVVAKLIVYCGWSLWDILLILIRVTDYVKRCRVDRRRRESPSIWVHWTWALTPKAGRIRLFIYRAFIHSLWSSLSCSF